jgi:hypothetical protein
MRPLELLQAALYIRGITMNKEGAQRKPSAGWSVQDNWQVGLLEAIS